MPPKRRRLWFFALCLLVLFTLPLASQEAVHSVQFDGMELQYPASLASGIRIDTVEAVPLLQPDAQLHAEAYPEHVRFGFAGYLDDAAFRLPYPVASAQIAVFSTDAMRAFGYEYAEGLDALNALLTTRPDLAEYAGANALPLLPTLYAAQVVRSHAAYVETAGASGIRYLTYYSQEAAPITDREIFYTFQGVTADGVYYVSAILPVTTDVLPQEIHAAIDWDAFMATYASEYLPETAAVIDGLSDDAFQPTLGTLDALVGSVAVDGASH